MSNLKTGHAATISAILVNYNDTTALINAVRQLILTQSPQLVEIVVVDNASREDARGRFDAARRSWPCSRTRIIWLQQTENLGFGRAVNWAYRRVSGDYLLLMNPDVSPRHGCVATLAEHLDRHRDVGLVAPKLLHPDGSLQYSCRRHYTLPVLALRRFPLNRIWSDHPLVRAHLMADWDHAEAREVDWVIGACVLLRRSALTDRVFDERFFLYFEDVDLAIDLVQRGWRVIYLPQAVAEHAHRRASARLLPSRAKVEHLLSLLKFIAKRPLSVFAPPRRGQH